jgi:hypothetical protein
MVISTKRGIAALTANLVAVSLLGGVTPAAAAPATAVPAQCGGMRQPAETLHIEWEAAKAVYKRGETAKILMTVTRPAGRDPADQDIETPRPMNEPAEGATVSSGAYVGEFFVSAGGPLTDAKGKTVVKLKLPKKMDTGGAFVNVYAFINYPVIKNAGTCVDPEEYGEDRGEDAFRVV